MSARLRISSQKTNVVGVLPLLSTAAEELGTHLTDNGYCCQDHTPTGKEEKNSLLGAGSFTDSPVVFFLLSNH